MKIPFELTQITIPTSKTCAQLFMPLHVLFITLAFLPFFHSLLRVSLRLFSFSSEFQKKPTSKTAIVIKIVAITRLVIFQVSFYFHCKFSIWTFHSVTFSPIVIKLLENFARSHTGMQTSIPVDPLDLFVLFCDDLMIQAFQ